MTCVRVMVVVVVAFVLALAGGTGAPAENYGGVSPATKSRVIRLIHSRFGGGWVGRTMVCIAGRESGFNPRAVNWGGPVFGVFQIKSGWRHHGETVRHFELRMYDPVENVDLALAIYRRSGLAPWGGRC